MTNIQKLMLLLLCMAVIQGCKNIQEEPKEMRKADAEDLVRDFAVYHRN